MGNTSQTRHLLEHSRRLHRADHDGELWTWSKLEYKHGLLTFAPLGYRPADKS